MTNCSRISSVVWSAVVSVGILAATSAGAACPPKRSIVPDSFGTALQVIPGSALNTACSGANHPTLPEAFTCAHAGDTIYVHGGTYYGQQYLANANGTTAHPIQVTNYQSDCPVFDGRDNASLTGGIPSGKAIIFLDASNVTLANLEVSNTGAPATYKGGNGIFVDDQTNVIVAGNKIHDISRSGIFVAGSGITVDRNEVYFAVLENQGGTQPFWSSAIQTHTQLRHFDASSLNINITRNAVYENWGECLDIADVIGSTVSENTVADCFSVNIYIENASNVTAYKNYVYADGDTYNRSGRRALGFGLAVEARTVTPGGTYAGQPDSNIKIYNNLITGMHQGLGYFEGGANSTNDYYKDVAFKYNTIYDVKNVGISIAAAYNTTAAHGTNAIQNNIIAAGSSGTQVIPSFWTVNHNDYPAGIPSGYTSGNYALSPGYLSPVTGGVATGFKIAATSAIKSLALPVSGITDDYFYCTRSTTAPSIGAAEATCP